MRLLFLASLALADNSAPPSAPKCHDATWRGIDKAFAAYCKAHPGKGLHGSCSEWLREYRHCSDDFTAAGPGWHILLRLFDCHDPIIVAMPDGKGWKVTEIKWKNYMPTPRMDPLEDLTEPSPSPK